MTGDVGAAAPVEVADGSMDGFLSLSAAVVDERGTLHVREPRGTNLFDLAMRLLNGTYEKPFAIDEDGMRRLHFGLLYIQSEMEIADPVRLCAAYTRTMMAFLLACPDPRHVLIVGQGGGSLAKFCHRHLPRTRITAVDSSADVIAFGRLFGVPGEDSRLRIVQDDALHFLQTTADEADVILVDLYDRRGPAALLGDAAFHTALVARLRRGGVLVSNLMGVNPTGEAHVDRLTRCFGQPPLLLAVDGENNRVALAGQSLPPPDWRESERRAADLPARMPLDFAALLRDMKLAAATSR